MIGMISINGGLVIGAVLMCAALAWGLQLNKNFVPTPQDANLVLQAAVTKTASFNSAGLDMGLRYAPGGVGAPAVGVVKVTAGDRSSGDETYSFHLEESSDDGNSDAYTTIGPEVAVTVATTVFTTGVISVPGFLSKRYVRLVCTVAGTTPSITYSATLSPYGAAVPG